MVIWTDARPTSHADVESGLGARASCLFQDYDRPRFILMAMEIPVIGMTPI